MNSDEGRKSFESHSSSSSANERINVTRRSEGTSSPEAFETSTRRFTTSSSLHGLLRRLGTVSIFTYSRKHQTKGVTFFP
jgi:hypothetical protein